MRLRISKRVFPDPAEDDMDHLHPYGMCDLCESDFYIVGYMYNIEYLDPFDGRELLIRSLCKNCGELSDDDFCRQVEWRMYSLSHEQYSNELDIAFLESISQYTSTILPDELNEHIQSRINSRVRCARNCMQLQSVLEELLKTSEIIRDTSRDEQTVRSGYVYLLGSPDGYCKIGRAKHLSARLLSIGLQLPFRVEILHSIKVSDRVWAERALHKKFAQCRANGEWFLLNAGDINWIKSLTRLEPGETY